MDRLGRWGIPILLGALVPVGWYILCIVLIPEPQSSGWFTACLWSAICGAIPVTLLAIQRVAETLPSWALKPAAVTFAGILPALALLGGLIASAFPAEEVQAAPSYPRTEFDPGAIRVEYGRDAFENGWLALPAVVTPQYIVPIRGEEDTMYSGLNCALAEGAKIHIGFPQRDFVTDKTLYFVSGRQVVMLSPDNTFTITDDTLIKLRGRGKPGDVYTPSLRLTGVPDAVRIATFKEAQGGQQLAWGRLPGEARWTFYVRFADTKGNNLPVETLMAATIRGGYVLSDDTKLLHEEMLAEAETVRSGVGLVDRESFLTICTPSHSEPIRVEVVVRIE